MKREVNESPRTQGIDESIGYILDTAKWGGSPSSPVVQLSDISALIEVDVSSTKLVGTPLASANTITTPRVTGLLAGRRYRMDIRWTAPTGSVIEAFCILIGES